MGTLAISFRRLQQQRLLGNRLAKPEEVVTWLGAVQAQDYAGAKWALGLRLNAASDLLVEKAFNEGAILRTHVMRPTWHFVTPADIRWLVELTAPRVNAVSAYMYRQLGLDDALFARSDEVIARALQGGQQLTRAEIGAALAEAGIAAATVRLGYIVFRAELDAVICSGPRRGKQFTYMLLDERAPHARVLARDEALAELTRRYFTGHGPATIRDFSWWSGLAVTDARRGLDIVGPDLMRENVEGIDYWFSPVLAPVNEEFESAFLLPTYDEFLMGFAAASRAGGQDVSELLFDSMIVVDGRIAGTWRRTIARGTVIIEVKMFASPFEGNERVAAAAERFGRFLGMPVSVKQVDV